MPMEHVFTQCLFGVQEQPLDKGQYQFVIIDPATNHVYRFPCTAEELGNVDDEIKNLLGKPKIALPGMPGIPSDLNGGSRN